MSARGDFEPLIDEATFYRAQAVLDGRVTSSQRHASAIIRIFRCEASCGARCAAVR